MLLEKPYHMNKFINNECPERWFSGKVPWIQINFLRLLLDGEQSKTTAFQRMKSHYYPDISKAVDELLKLTFIEKTREDNETLSSERGHKPEKFYKITANGLNALLKIFTLLSPQQFWETAFLFSIKQENYIKNEFERIYSKYERNIIGYYSNNGYLTKPFSINLLFQKWYKVNYILDNVDSVFAPESQIILECLARNRISNFKSISRKNTDPKNENTNDFRRKF